MTKHVVDFDPDTGEYTSNWRTICRPAREQSLEIAHISPLIS